MLAMKSRNKTLPRQRNFPPLNDSHVSIMHAPHEFITPDHVKGTTFCSSPQDRMQVKDDQGEHAGRERRHVVNRNRSERHSDARQRDANIKVTGQHRWYRAAADRSL